MARRRRRKTGPWIVYGGIIAVLVALLVVVLVLLLGHRGGSSGAALDALVKASEHRSEPAQKKPWEGKEKDAILRAKRTPTARSGGPSIDQEIFDGDLSKRVELYKELGLKKGVWHARHVSDRSLYWVSYNTVFYGIEIGPKWLVQLDPKGKTPKAYPRGVIPANALATLLMTKDPSGYQRYLNKTDAVLDVLLKHRFDNGLPLSSAILIYFAGRNKKLNNSRLIGWAVVPQRAQAHGTILYDAFLQWREHGNLKIAHFEVDLSKNRFKARNLLANEIVADAASMEEKSVIDIRPHSISRKKASRERDPMLRALRYILNNDQLISSVGALLSYRAKSNSFSYDGWRIEPDNCTTCTVSYRYSEKGEEHEVSWKVTPRGTLSPQSAIAKMATAAISIAKPMADNAQARRDTDGDSP